jgi:hypothetical protein
VPAVNNNHPPDPQPFANRPDDCARRLGPLQGLLILLLANAFIGMPIHAQQRGGRGAAPGPPPTGQAAAPVDVTGYWVSMIVDEWRFRVSPQKGDILYMPLNPEARRVANEWDPAKDEADGKACRAYGAVGVMQRPGRLHITWADPNTLTIDADAGTQSRTLHFGPPPAQFGAPSWQGYSTANWRVNGRLLIDTGGQGLVAAGRQSGTSTSGTLIVATTNMLPGYLRKNGVPYSEKATLTEYINRLSGQQNDVYLSVTAMVEDPTYLTQPFVRTYTFKKQNDASGWDPTPCWNR